MSEPTTSPPWRSAAAARPLKAWRRAQLEDLAALLRAAWGAWVAAWGLQWDAASAVASAPAREGDLAGASWEPVGTRHDGHAWIAVPADFRVQLARGLFDVEEAGTPVLAAVLAACRADLLARIRTALRLDAAMPPAQPPQVVAWSGAVIARLPGGAQVFASASVLESVLGDGRKASAVRGTPPVPLAHALGRQQLDVQVTLAGCEIDVGTLHALRPGDVLPLRHPLSTPAQVCTRTGEAVFSGHLVRRGSLRGIELATAARNGKQEGA